MIETLNKTRFLIDFGGFYDSVHSDILDIQIDYFKISLIYFQKFRQNYFKRLLIISYA